MADLINKLGIPGTIGAVILIGWLVLQAIGELCELKGKLVPEFMKIRKYFKRKKEEKLAQQLLLQKMQKSLDVIKEHCSPENIAERNTWMATVNANMQWTHTQANSYDASIDRITTALNNAATALAANTEMTEKMFIESSRDRIIDFAEKASNYDLILSREQFRRIDKVYNKYEEFLEARGLQNGEIDVAYEMIQDGYRHRLRNHSFVEDMNGFTRN